MQLKKPFVILVPKSFDEDLKYYLKLKPPPFKYHVEYFYFVFNKIVRLKIIFKKKEFISFNLKSLKSNTVSNILRYIKYMENNEFIISNNSYYPGAKSKGYKINSKYLGSDIIKHEISINSKLFLAIERKQRLDKANYNRLEPHIYDMLGKFKKLELNYHRAYEWINKNIAHDKTLFYQQALSNFEDHRMRYFKRSKTNNRLNTNLTSLSSSLRQFIIGDDLVSIDLKNSQPFLLSIFIKYIINYKNINKIKKKNKLALCCNFLKINTLQSFKFQSIMSISKIHQKSLESNDINLSLFFQSTLNGRFYDNFINHYPGNINREEVKKIMFAVLFSQNIIFKDKRVMVPYKKEKDIFAKLFPFIYEVITLLKQNDYKKLSIFLQKLESYIFIDVIAKRLVDAGIVPLTIHDSVIVEKVHKEKTMEIIMNSFDELFGYKPTFEIKQINNLPTETGKILNLTPIDNAKLQVHPKNQQQLLVINN